jgi:hypothetical protein
VIAFAAPRARIQVKVHFTILLRFNKTRIVDVNGFLQLSEVELVKTASRRPNEISSDEDMSCTFERLARYLPSSVIFQAIYDQSVKIEGMAAGADLRIQGLLRILVGLISGAVSVADGARCFTDSMHGKFREISLH